MCKKCNTSIAISPERLCNICAERALQKAFEKISETITEKQKRFISFIEDETGVVFEGKSKKEASKYIEENKDKIPASASINMWAIVNGY